MSHRLNCQDSVVAESFFICCGVDELVAKHTEPEQKLGTMCSTILKVYNPQRKHVRKVWYHR